MYFVTFSVGDLIESYDARDIDEAIAIRDLLCSGGFEAVIVRYVKG